MSDQGDGTRTRSQGSTTPCADPLTPPPIDPGQAPSERFELPTPSFVARCSRSAELRRHVCGSVVAWPPPARGGGAPRARRRPARAERRTRPAGLAPAPFRPTTGCSAFELWPQCGAPAARRDSGCAEQRESRDPLPIAPCHAGRRRSTCCNYCVFLPRPSVVKQQVQIPRLATLARDDTGVQISTALLNVKRPTWLMAQAGRVEPLLSGWSSGSATAHPPGTRTLHHCVLHRVGNRTRSSCCTSLRSSAAFGRSAVPVACRAWQRRRRPTIAHSIPSRRWARASPRRTGAGRCAVGVRWVDA